MLPKGSPHAAQRLALRALNQKEVTQMSRGRFGKFGGQYVPETLMNELIRLEEQYNYYKNDPAFCAELTELLNSYAGRPSRLYYAGKMTEDLGGARIYLKREDLNHTGAHKINNCLGQVLLAKKNGKDPRDRGDGSRPARRGDGNGRGAFRTGVRGVHGPSRL